MPHLLRFQRAQAKRRGGVRFGFALVYILEAHADDEWVDPDNAKDDVCFKKPRSLEQRIAIARAFSDGAGIPPARIVVDSMENQVELAYEARPEKLVVVKDGVIVFKSGIGPYQYSPVK